MPHTLARVYQVKWSPTDASRARGAQLVAANGCVSPGERFSVWRTVVRSPVERERKSGPVDVKGWVSTRCPAYAARERPSGSPTHRG